MSLIKYKFRKYSSKYIELFKREKLKLSKIVSNCSIFHIGSTSVPGLGGKGVIDIMIVTNNLNSNKKKLILANYNFSSKASVENRLFFYREYKYAGTIRFVHLHLIKKGSLEEKLPLAFRQLLIDEPLIRKEYSVLKREGLLKSKGCGETYRTHKNNWIKEKSKKALEKYF